MKIAAILLALALPLDAFGEEVTPTENIHGCLMRFCNFGGDCVTDYFVKVADNENDSDEGESQIWGYDPNNIHFDKNGKIIFVSVLARNFIKAGGAAHLEHTPCFCHCRQW